jgi:hypothetical protein
VTYFRRTFVLDRLGDGPSSIWSVLVLDSGIDKRYPLGHPVASVREAACVANPSGLALFLPELERSIMIRKKIFVVLLFLLFLASRQMQAQTIHSHVGIEASQVGAPELDVDPNGAIGTKQFMEWTNVYYQAYDKATFKPVWTQVQNGIQPWQNNKMSNCYSITGDGTIIFDRLASRWVIAGHNSPGINGKYYYCVAVSSTDDLSSPKLTWYTYSFLLNPVLGVNSLGHVYFPDWPSSERGPTRTMSASIWRMLTTTI